MADLTAEGCTVYFEDEDTVYATAYNAPVPAIGETVTIERTDWVVRNKVWRFQDLEFTGVRSMHRASLVCHVILQKTEG